MSEDQTDTEMVLVHLEPDEDEWGSRNDERWRDDLFTLRRSLEHAAPGEVRPAPVGADAMGPELIPILIGLGHAGVYTAMIAGLKAWFAQRPKRRSVTATWQVGERTGTITLTSENVGSSDLAAIVHDALHA